MGIETRPDVLILLEQLELELLVTDRVAGGKWRQTILRAIPHIRTICSAAAVISHRILTKNFIYSN